MPANGQKKPNCGADRLFVPIKDEEMQRAILNYKKRTGHSYERIISDCLKIPMNDMELLQDRLNDLQEQLIRMSPIHKVDKIEGLFLNLYPVFYMMCTGKLDADTVNDYVMKMITECRK